jgi:hypothetical protein
MGGVQGRAAELTKGVLHRSHGVLVLLDARSATASALV